MIIKRSGELGSWMKSEDHPNYYIIENGQNTEKNLGELRRLAVTQSPVKDHQLKTIMSKIIIIIIIFIINNNNNNNNILRYKRIT